MKKTKSGEKTKKGENTNGLLKDESVNIVTPEPNQEVIRQIANEIYQQRIERGESGTAEKDWLEAENHLRVDD